jgi:hypothetical protein
MRRRWIRFSHYAIKGILCLMWLAVIYQGVIYFINPIRAESYRLAVVYWRGLWDILF